MDYLSLFIKQRPDLEGFRWPRPECKKSKRAFLSYSKTFCRWSTWI